MHALTTLPRRVWLAGKYYFRLRYSWHLAWTKAAPGYHTQGWR